MALCGGSRVSAGNRRTVLESCLCESRSGNQTQIEILMTFIYYSEADKAIYLLSQRATDHGSLIGSISSLPKKPAFLIQSLLTNAGYGEVTGLTIIDGPRPAQAG